MCAYIYLYRTNSIYLRLYEFVYMLVFFLARWSAARTAERPNFPYKTQKKPVTFIIFLGLTVWDKLLIDLRVSSIFASPLHFPCTGITLSLPICGTWGAKIWVWESQNPQTHMSVGTEFDGVVIDVLYVNYGFHTGCHLKTKAHY